MNSLKKEASDLSTDLSARWGRPFSAVLKLGPAPDYKLDFDFGNKEEDEPKTPGRHQFPSGHRKMSRLRARESIRKPKLPTPAKMP